MQGRVEGRMIGREEGGGQTSSGGGAEVISHDILLHELIQLGGGAGHREGGRLLQKCLLGAHIVLWSYISYHYSARVCIASYYLMCVSTTRWQQWIVSHNMCGLLRDQKQVDTQSTVR